MIKKISISVVLLTLLLFMNTSCKKYLDVNKNVDAPTYVDGYLYLAGIIEAYQGMYWDVRAAGGLTEMLGTSGFVNFANHFYDAGSDNGGEQWRFVYWLQGMNLENMINESVQNQNWTLAGIGYAIKAFSWDQLTKYHSEVILKEAFQPGLLSFDYDYQDSIYPQVRRWAYQAINYLQMTDNISYGTKISGNDYLFGGDKSKWLKFAYGVIVSNLASLSNKTDFITKYAPELISCAAKSLQSNADNAVITVLGGGSSAAQSAYNNFWGTYRGNLSYTYWQHEYAVQVLTGSVPAYDETTGNKIPVSGNTYYPYQLAAKQIICDTITTVAGHYDPRVALKLGTIDDPSYNNMNNTTSIMRRKYYGGTYASTTGPIGTASSLYGRNASSLYSGAINDGKGRWLYRDDAPYILMTYAQIKFDLAEAYWKLSDKPNAYAAFKAGVYADLDFTGTYISPGTAGSTVGGDKISVAAYNTLEAQYKAGPYVDGLAMVDFSLSHIMMQKWVALYPWGAQEVFTDLRKYHWDLKYTGDYPKSGNGWDISAVYHKWDSDPTKVYKGFFLNPAQVQGRKGTFDPRNQGSPCYRIRPRYNSEYMWNKPALSGLLPIAGTADNYQCSIPWFAYPGEVPATTK